MNIICDCGKKVKYDGKRPTVCPKCKTVYGGVLHKARPAKLTKPDYKKHPAKSNRNAGDMWTDLGALLVSIPPILFFGGLWNNGLGSFRMDLFTLVVVLMLVGRTMFVLSGNKKKAR